MFARKTGLVRLALFAAFALGAVACASEASETSETDEPNSDEQTEQAARPEVKTDTTTVKDGIGEKGSSCPIWQCGFNGLRPETMKLVSK